MTSPARWDRSSRGVGGVPLDIVIVGGGPVGLLAGLCAHAAGLRFKVFERDHHRREHSRAIGIHPPSLRLIASVDQELADRLVSEGIRIRRGHGMAGPGRPIGSLDFSLLGPPYPYVLTLPQWRTEMLLEEALRRRSPDALERGVEVAAPPTARDARITLACDGRDSRMREAAGIEVKGAVYPVRYVMGDFPSCGWPNDPELKHDAFLFLTPTGLVESFPVESGARRWVAEVEGAVEPDPDRLSTVVAARCGVELEPKDARMISTFQPEHRTAERFWSGTLLLCGDAAHVVTPIGGQGMNLGWLNAADAVSAAAAVVAGGDPARHFPAFERRARRRARRARRRGEQNMFLANRTRTPQLRSTILGLALRSPLRRVFARRFTMHGL
jgi:2-polyprenyl-6-methoxyphenol hydroxylase-like FAD-dependent oxidoreductase